MVACSQEQEYRERATALTWSTIADPIVEMVARIEELAGLASVRIVQRCFVLID